jgi:hypothetical protein
MQYLSQRVVSWGRVAGCGLGVTSCPKSIRDLVFLALLRRVEKLRRHVGIIFPYLRFELSPIMIGSGANTGYSRWYKRISKYFIHPLPERLPDGRNPKAGEIIVNLITHTAYSPCKYLSNCVMKEKQLTLLQEAYEYHLKHRPGPWTPGYILLLKPLLNKNFIEPVKFYQQGKTYLRFQITAAGIGYLRDIGIL